jgi:hypothetical protein
MHELTLSALKNAASAGLDVTAASSSEWFPLADVSDKLKKLRTLAKGSDKGSAPVDLWADPAKPFGQSLQSMRLLESADLLRSSSDTLAKMPVHFISYRIRDGSRGAFNKTRELFLSGDSVSVFWDRWSLLRRLAERRELVDDRVLNRFLMLRLRESERVWGIESLEYSARGSYSKKERKAAKRLKTYSAVELSQPDAVQFFFQFDAGRQ